MQMLHKTVMKMMILTLQRLLCYM